MIRDIQGLIEKISKEVRSFTDIGVVGLSGGVDSLVVSCLLIKALGKENVVTIHMPYGDTDLKTENKFNNNSLKISDKLGTVSHYRPITKIADAISETVLGEFTHSSVVLTDLNKGNARARARMCVLYGASHHLETSTKKRARVIGTGNLSEDWIGYDTKGGDALGDLFIIGELFKSEVYQLAEYFVKEGMIDEAMIDRKPSAGLFDGHTDEAELGYSYNDMEPSVRRLMAFKDVAEVTSELDRFVWNRHVSNKHKHEAPPVLNIRKEYCD